MTGRPQGKTRPASPIPRRWRTSWPGRAPSCWPLPWVTSIADTRASLELRWDVLQDIAVRTHIPLVLHGASGIQAEELAKAPAMNVGKVNFNTELRTAVLEPRWRRRTAAHRADGKNLQGLLVRLDEVRQGSSPHVGAGHADPLKPRRFSPTAMAWLYGALSLIS